MACKLLNKKINNTQDLAVVVLTTSKREKKVGKLKKFLWNQRNKNEKNCIP